MWAKDMVFWRQINLVTSSVFAGVRSYSDHLMCLIQLQMLFFKSESLCLVLVTVSTWSHPSFSSLWLRREFGLGVINLNLSQQRSHLLNKLCEVPQLSVWWLGRTEPSLDFQAGEFSFNPSIMSSLCVSQQKSMQCFLTLLLLFFLVWLFYVQKWNMSKDNLFGKPVGKLQRCIKFSKLKW